MTRIAQDTWFDFWFKRKDNFLAWRFTNLAWMLRHLNLKEGGSILDLGCGASWTPLMLAIQGYEVTASDLHNFDYGFPQYKFVVGDATTVEFESEFDRILSMGLLMHLGIQQPPYDLEADMKAVQNVNRFLKDDGYWMVSLCFGKETIFSGNRRIYSQKRLDRIFPEIVEQVYFVRDGKFWRKTDLKEAEKAVHIRSGPLAATTCLIAKKVGH